MKVSLKEGRRIERRIQDKALRNGYPLRGCINIYDNVSVENEVATVAGHTESRLFNALDLIAARSIIRRLIQSANEISGINALIADREKFIRILGVWEDVVETAKGIQTTTAITGALDSKLARAQAGNSEYSTHPNVIEFVAITPEFKELAEKNTQDTQRKIDGCDDELLALNSLTKIEIPEDVYQILADNGVV